MSAEDVDTLLQTKHQIDNFPRPVSILDLMGKVLRSVHKNPKKSFQTFDKMARKVIEAVGTKGEPLYFPPLADYMGQIQNRLRVKKELDVAAEAAEAKAQEDYEHEEKTDVPPPTKRKKTKQGGAGHRAALAAKVRPHPRRPHRVLLEHQLFV